MPLKLNPVFNDHVVGFNGSSAPLGQRKDLVKLYEIGKAHNTKSILNLFSEHPSESELQELKAEAFNQKKAKP